MSFIYDLTDTWNSSGTTFTAIKMNVTNSASSTSSKLIDLQISGTTNFSVDKNGQGYFSGNVGIGTSSPTQKLTVSGGSVNADNFYIQTQGASQAGAVGFANANGPGIQFWGSSTGNAGSLTFNTASTERMRLDSSGNLGIGTSSPGAKLHISAVSTANQLFIERTGSATGKWSLYAESNSLYFRDQVASADRMVIDASGNLGLGVTPSAWLSSQKALEVSGWSVNAASVTSSVATNAYVNASSQWIYKATGYATRYDNVTGQHQWYTAPSGTAGAAISFTQAMTLDASGNLGIGTSSPSEKLSLQSSGGVQVATKYVNSNTAGVSMGAAADGSAFVYQGSALPFIVYTNGTERMRIDSSGNVGIGTSSPGSKLHIYGSAAGAATQFTVTNTDATGFGGVSFTDGTNTKGQIWVGNSSYGSFGGAGSVNYSANSGPHVWYTNYSERMRIDSSGNVGIGTSSPTQKLTVSGAVNADNFYIQTQGASQAGTIGFANANGPGIQFWGSSTGNAGALTINTASTERMRIDSSGNLLVGTTTAYGKIATVTAASGQPAIYCRGLTDARSSATTQTSGTSYFDYFVYNGTTVGSITSTGTTTAYNTTSDARLKENIADADDASALVDSIKIRQFDWKANGEHQRHGVIAQELIEVAPEAVTPGRTDDDMMSVDYSKLVPMLIKEIQSLRARVAQLEGK